MPARIHGGGGQPFGFRGGPTGATGLLDLRARLYDPQLGRFLQKDPFGGLASDPLPVLR